MEIQIVVLAILTGVAAVIFLIIAGTVFAYMQAAITNIVRLDEYFSSAEKEIKKTNKLLVLLLKDRGIEIPEDKKEEADER